MLIIYNRTQLMDLRKLTKHVNLSGFPYGPIMRIRELQIQKRIQERKKPAKATTTNNME